MTARYIGIAFNLRDNGRMRTEAGQPDDPTGKAGADNALNADSCADIHLPAGMANGQPSADTRAGGAAVDFSLGKDADMSAVGR